MPESSLAKKMKLQSRFRLPAVWAGSFESFWDSTMLRPNINRGIGYADKGDYDRAIADFN